MVGEIIKVAKVTNVPHRLTSMGGLFHRWIIAISAAFVLFGTISSPAATLLYEVPRAKVLELCQGTFKGKRPTSAELDRVLKDHGIWTYNYMLRFHTPEAQSDPRRANFCGANLEKASLNKTNLLGGDLSGAVLEQTNLSGSFLAGANLSGAVLEAADLSEATLMYANLSVANLYRANLSDARLYGANLSGALLIGANLNGANLKDTNLSGADLRNANLSGVKFEPKSLPDVFNIAYAKNLESMNYSENPKSLTKLRKEFKEAGLYEQERKITYAIKHSETKRKLDWKRVSALVFLEGVFSYIFFDFTTLWGMAPGRAMLILLSLILVFAIPYVIALKRQGKNGIWCKWADDRVRTDLGTKKPVLLRENWCRALSLGLYFSVLSAFNIGWRELSVGSWIQRLQPNEYTLKASGWVRYISGVQALISVYLLAIWVLTYFSRPFE